MKKVLIVLFVLLVALSMAALMFVPLASAQDSSTSTVEVVTEEINTDDDVGILPGNPFYFLKEWARGMRRSLISDPIKRVEFELKVTTEKGEELRRVSGFNRQEIVEKAAENYEEAVRQLRERLGELGEVSGNPNVEELLQQLRERTQQHEQLFEELKNKFESLRGRLENIQGNLDDVALPLMENVENLGRVRDEITGVIESGDVPYGVVSEITERVGEEIRPVANVTVGEKIDEVRPLPMVVPDKLSSIITGVRETFRIGQTQYDIRPIICADVYVPVCGEDGKLYSNECYAIRANVNVAYDGPCQE